MKIGKPLLLEMYRTMLTIRMFEERCNELFLQGRIPSTLHLYIGQEAVATGVCANLKDSDYILSTHRPHGHAIAKGVDVQKIMAELFGKVTGCCKGKGGSMHIGDIKKGMLPANAIVGANAPIANGLAWAQKQLGNSGVTVCFFGDGAANEGAIHEAMNIAGVWELPVIYICENNLYAASTPYKSSFKIDNIADRAVGYGIPGIVVDGNDVQAVYKVAHQAVENARSGGGATFIECKTYRMCGHSRSDPKNYRTKEEEATWSSKDPIKQLAGYLERNEQIDQKKFSEIEQEVIHQLDDAVAFAEKSLPPSPSDTLNDVFFKGKED